MSFQTINNPKTVRPPIIHVSARLAMGAGEQACSVINDAKHAPRGRTLSSNHKQLQYQAQRFCMEEAIRAAYKQRCPSTMSAAEASHFWPKGLIGATTQTSTFVSAAVSFSDRTQLLGIDSEKIFSAEALSRLWPIILTKREVAFYEWNHKRDMDRSTYGSLLFSAKQSMLKAFAPLKKRQLSYQDILILPERPEKGQFLCELLRPLHGEFTQGYQCQGQFDFLYGHVHTAIEIQAQV